MPEEKKRLITSTELKFLFKDFDSLFSSAIDKENRKLIINQIKNEFIATLKKKNRSM